MNQDGNNQLIKTKKKDTQTDNKECDAPESNITDMHQFTMIIDDLECQLKQFKHIVKMNQQLISELKTKLSEKIVQIEIQNKAISNVIRKVENIDLQNNKQLQDIKSKSQSVQTQFVNEHNNSTNHANKKKNVMTVIPPKIKVLQIVIEAMIILLNPVTVKRRKLFSFTNFYT